MKKTPHTDCSPGTALITGAAKRIGAVVAEHLAAQGWNLVLHYHRSRDDADALAARLQPYDVEVTLHQANLRDTAALERFWNGLPACNALIHNAALFQRDTLASMRASTLREQLAVNFETPLLLTQGFMKQLPEQTAGHVMVLGDGAMGWSISPEFFSYGVSKQAWVGTIELLAAACAPRARVNMLALAPTLPGPGDTPEMFARLAERAPLRRTGDPVEVAAAISYLLQAPGVTGQTLSLGNGMGLASHRPSA